MKCDIIIPIWNQLELTTKCIESIKRNTNYPYRLILIDNGSGKEIKSYLKNLKTNSDIDITLISNTENLGWIRGINIGLKEAKSDYICFLNNDIEVSDGWLGRLIDVVNLDRSIGIVNPSWEKPKKGSAGTYTELDYCRGFCMFIKKEVIDRIGGLDEIFGMGYYDDWDFSLRAIKSGFRCVRANRVNVIHHKEKSFSLIFDKSEWNELFERNKKIFYKKWGKPLKFFWIFDLKSSKEEITELEGLLKRSLKRQHKIKLFTDKKIGAEINHSNFKKVIIPGIFLNVFALAAIFNDKRKKPGKKYNIIYTNSKNLFNRLDYPDFRGKYKVYFDNFKNGFSERFTSIINKDFEKPLEAEVL